MPLFEYLCLQCGQVNEVLVTSSEAQGVTCLACGGKKLKKMLSAPSILSKQARGTLTPRPWHVAPGAPSARKPGSTGTPPAQSRVTGM